MVTTGQVTARPRVQADGMRQALATLRAWWVVPAALTLAVAGPLDRHFWATDWPIAQVAGKEILSGNLAVYATMPEAQMGPLALLLAGSLPKPLYAILVALALPVLLVLAAGPKPSLRTMALLGIGGSVLAFPWTVYAIDGHGDDALVALGAVAMCAALRHGHRAWVVAGFVLAIAAKPTAILFLPLAFMHSRRAGVVALVVGGAVWLPFVLADVSGFLEAGGGISQVRAGSTLNLLGVDAGGPFPWWVRPVQFVGGMLLCWVVARRVGPWLAVSAVFAFRTLLEPGGYSTYFVAVIVGAVLVDAIRGRMLVLPVAAAAWAVVFTYGGGMWVSGAVLCVLVLSASLRAQATRPQPNSPEGPPPPPLVAIPAA